MASLLFAGNCHAQWSRVNQDTIRLDGDIDKDSYQSYLDVAKGGYAKVILHSNGGSPMPALMIAGEMREHQPQITVEGTCLSACANYLLLAAPAPHVECGAILIWHGSPADDVDSEVRVMRAEDKNPKLIAKYGAWGSKLKAMERDFYAAIGVNRKLLSDSVAIVQRDHVTPEATFSFDEMTGDYSETVSSGLWVPTTKTMRGYGIDTRNFCPTYDADIPATLKRLNLNAHYTSAGPD
jgi:hypothetical protein